MQQLEIAKKHAPAKAFESIYEQWVSIRKIKQSLGRRPDEDEKEIDNLINAYIDNKGSSDIIQVLIQKIIDHTDKLIRGFVPNNRFAVCTFATKKQASLALSIVQFAHSEGNDLSACMYHNEPEWILDGRKITQAQEDAADIADKDSLYDDEKALISMRNNEIRVEKFLSQKRMRDYYFGSDDAELIQAANLAKTPEEAQHILDEMKIDADKHMAKRRQNLTLFSQDRDKKVSEGDFYTTESEDDMPYFRGRLNDQKSFGNLVDHFEHKILHLPDKPFDIKELEENIHYRQKAYTGFLTPQNMTMMEGDPEQARKAFEDAKRYFVDTKDSPQEDAKISKKKFQDHPEVRYVASSPFDYSVIPSVGEKIITDEQQMI